MEEMIRPGEKWEHCLPDLIICIKSPGDGNASLKCLINSSAQWAVDRRCRLTGEGGDFIGVSLML